MTDQFKKEEHEKYINQALKTALDPLDWEAKVSLMGKIIERIENHLPPEIKSQPPERFAGHYESIVTAYVQSMDRMKSILRSL